MSTETALRRRRGVSRASITRLGNRLGDLEGMTSDVNTLDLAQQLKKKLENLDSEFKTHHYNLIDVVDDSHLEAEQTILDEHDEDLAMLTIRIQHLIEACASSRASNPQNIASRRLLRLRKCLTSVDESIASLSGEPGDVCVLHQHQEQLSDFKAEVADICNSILPLGLEDEDNLIKLQNEIEKHLFDCSLEIKRLLQPQTCSGMSESKGIKLPKLEVPTFDGNILNWKSFWEQFCVSIHNRSSLSDSEKLVYLQSALKDGSAKQVIEGLSRSGKYYAEAIECLCSRFNRPRLIHQTHVKMILDATPLKDGNGRELRRLHDTAQQHLRALKAMDYEPSGPFITSVLELKLDTNTMFEWKKFSQDEIEVPHYQKLLEFINLRAQASESSITEHSKKPKYEATSGKKLSKPIASFAGTASPVVNCVVCDSGNHPLYACPKFKALSHDQMMSTLRTHNLCMNCLRSGHFVKQCKSLHQCRKCQKPHHTLLHVEPRSEAPPTSMPPNSTNLSATPIPSHVAMGIKSNLLLMTCNVTVISPAGYSVQARALLDSASSTSFVSEKLAQCLHLPRSSQNALISGVAGLARNCSTQFITHFGVCSTYSPTRKIDVTAVVVPRVTCDLPLHPVPFNSKWNHLSNICLADPGFGHPGRIDLLLGVEVFIDAVYQGRRSGPPDSPVAFETEFGWVLAGNTEPISPSHHIVAHHISLLSGDDLLRKFWEIEEKPMTDAVLSSEERTVLQHFKSQHSRTDTGRFIVPLPKKSNLGVLGESRSQAVRRFLSLERSLHAKGQFQELETAMQEYFDMGHAEPVPETDLHRPQGSVFYLPMHTVRKESSTTTRVRAVFDASAKSSNGTSLNDILLIGPTIHSSLVDVLLRFRMHRIALTTDVSRMYRAVLLAQSDRDLHRFVWRNNPSQDLRDYRMTRVTFGVSASSFAANMSVHQNAIDLASEYPLAAKTVEESFYVDDGLTGADSVDEAIKLQGELQDLFERGGFLLRKWNSNNSDVLQHISPEIRDSKPVHGISEPDSYAKALGMEWNVKSDCFRLTVTDFPSLEDVTKRILVSDIAKTFDVLGWFSPTIITMKILLQRLWELKIGWDDPVPEQIYEVWARWRSELKLLSNKHISRCYFPRDAHIISTQLHGFSDASERAYAGVVYLRMMDSNRNIHIALVMSKTKVAPIKRITIPRLELCGAHLLAQVLHHVKEVFHLPLDSVYAWTDSTIVLNWLTGNSRRFKPYVSNRISHIMDLIPPNRWSHVKGTENPADCASRGILPTELISHPLWWTGPDWLRWETWEWPRQSEIPPNTPAEEANEICLHITANLRKPIIPFECYSSFIRLQRVTAWIHRFVHNCRSGDRVTGPLMVKEIKLSETHFVLAAQEACFTAELSALKSGHDLPTSSCLLPLRPFLDSYGILRVGGRGQNSKQPYHTQHPIILQGKHLLTRLIIRSEHLRLLHAGPLLLTSSLSRWYHIIGCRRIVRSITRGCITCRRISVRPQPPIMGQLPKERVTPDSIFDRVGIDYAGPVLIKHAHVRKPTIVKAYVCVFVALSVKAVHLELVSDLTSEAFLACLRRFIARRGSPSLIWSDHGSNFVGAARELKELVKFLEQQKTQRVISEFCTTQRIQWKFIPERAPHFGGLWEAAVKSMKTHLRRIVGDVKLTFEEFSTVLSQIEACLNSRPLISLSGSEDGIESLTPGHFLIGRPLESFPDPASSYQSLSVLRRWHLCQSLVRHFWKRWSGEYLISLQRLSKWHRSPKNLTVGDIVILREDNMTTMKWPLARITQTHAGKDGVVRVVTLKTPTGVYTRPVTKLVPLLSGEL